MTTRENNKPLEPELGGGALVSLADQPPAVLPAVVAYDVVPFPGPVVPVLLDSQTRRDAVLHAKSGNGFFLIVNRAAGFSTAQSPPEEAPAPANDVEVLLDDNEEQEPPRLREIGDLSPVGVLARVIRVFRLPDDRMSVLAQLVRRAQPVEILRRDPFPVVRVLYPVETVRNQQRFEATFRQLRINVQAFFEAHPNTPDEVKMAAMNIEEPGVLADFVAQHLARDYDERLAFLGELRLEARLQKALEVCVRELDLLTVGNRISQEIRDKVEKHQRDYFLREQLKSIRQELGEAADPATLAIKELEAKLEEAALPEAAQQRAKEELNRLAHVPPESPEHNVVRSYLEWISSLPWSKESKDRRDIDHARKVLDADHYGLDEVKDRVVEFLAVHQLNPQRTGSILCFAGPPGVGKTSLGQSIARALGREFYRFSVGGMRDEAEIKGHRRTYVGAMPGRLLQGLRQVGTRNPVFMLDELDKTGSDWRGDPSSALLEVLDPAQNSGFLDHYLDLPFDLSRVMFIATANIKTEIPDALRDRLEIIDLAGYIPEEKLQIARRHLLPRERKEHGLTSRQLQLGMPVLRRMIQDYTHEAGVRELNRVIGKTCRKRATQVVRKQRFKASITAKDLPIYLGPPKISDDGLLLRPTPGLAVGLAWTPVGGDVLFIEIVAMEGSGKLKVTGQLGEVMSESAQLSVSYVRSRAAQFGIDADFFKSHDLHLHFPAGAVKKDGPSAGVTITTALLSLLRQQSVRPRLAMTGEMTLRGDVLPVGGIREKVVAARRAGVRTVVLPERNRADVQEIPKDIRDKLQFVFASTYDDVESAAFRGTAKRNQGTPRKAPSARRAAHQAKVAKGSAK